MPQLEKGGKYVFGSSPIRPDGSVRLPDEARQEYHIEPGENVILIVCIRFKPTCGGLGTNLRLSAAFSFRRRLVRRNLSTHQLKAGGG